MPAYAGSAWRGAFGHALKRLVCVTREPACPPCPERLTLRFLTPLRLNSAGQLVSQDRFRFHHLFASLRRPISLLTAFHTDTSLDADFAGLSQAVRAVALKSARLRWHDWSRSGRICGSASGPTPARARSWGWVVTGSRLSRRQNRLSSRQACHLCIFTVSGLLSRHLN